MMFGEYFPNPGAAGTGEAALALVSSLGAMAVEGVGNCGAAHQYTCASNAGRCDPARDFGSRLVSLFEGWGEMAIPGPSGGLWADIAGPLVGGQVGAAVYEFLLRPAVGRNRPLWRRRTRRTTTSQSARKQVEGLWPQ